MAIIADYIAPCGCRVRINDADIDPSPEAQQRCWEAFWDAARQCIRESLESGKTREELEEWIRKANAEGDAIREETMRICGKA